MLHVPSQYSVLPFPRQILCCGHPMLLNPYAACAKLKPYPACAEVNLTAVFDEVKGATACAKAKGADAVAAGNLPHVTAHPVL